jgi:hypothetical protein
MLKYSVTMKRGVMLLPWIQIQRPITVGDIVFHPFADALALAGQNEPRLRSFGETYVEGVTLGLAIERGERTPYLLPTVVFVEEDDASIRAAHDAVDVLMLATIFENHGFGANGTTFERVLRPLDVGHPFVVDRVPRMHGATINMSGPMALVMRPPHTGPFHHVRRPAMVDALWEAMNGPAASEFREILDTLRTALSESPIVSMVLAESLMAKVATLLVHRKGLPDEKAVLLARVRGLLGHVLVESTGDAYGFHIARVWQVVRDHRNDFWHPERRGGDAFPFSAQTMVTPFMLALRMAHALVAARLIELGHAEPDSELAADIVGIERWIATLEPSLEDGLEMLTGVKLEIEHMQRADTVESSYGSFRIDARFRTRMRGVLARQASRAPSLKHQSQP